MKSLEIARDALDSLVGHPLRSLLTILGVVTGVAAVIAVIAISEGSRRTVLRQLEVLGTRLLVALPGPAAGDPGARTDTLTREDARAVESLLPGLQVSPEALGRVTVRKGKQAVSAPLIGALPSFLRVRNFRLSQGRFFTLPEDRARARVCVLGPKTAARLFPSGNPVGNHIFLEGARYRVLGVFEARGDLGWFHPDEVVVVPLSTAQVRILGISYVHAIAVKCPRAVSMEEVEARMVALLRRRHRLPPELPKDRLDFHVINQKEMIEAMAEVSRMFKALLISLAGVALVTGGVGIMNIMLVSVAERTSEIGIRKAVGARKRDIFFQFLSESVFLSGAGAILGVFAGMGVSRWLSAYGQWEAVISVEGVLTAVAMALLVGLLFGAYPAYRAAGLEPVEALRAG